MGAAVRLCWSDDRRECAAHLHPDRRCTSLSRPTAEFPPCRVLWLLLSAAGAAAVRHPLPRAAHAGFFGILCSDVLESVADLSGVMGSDHHAAGDALRVLIPPPYAHPVYSRASCGLSLLPYHADGAERHRQVHEKPRADRSGTAARTSRAEHGVCAGSVSSSGVAACGSAFRFRRCKRRGAPGCARQLL